MMASTGSISALNIRPLRVFKTLVVVPAGCPVGHYIVQDVGKLDMIHNPIMEMKSLTLYFRVLVTVLNCVPLVI